MTKSVNASFVTGESLFPKNYDLTSLNIINQATTDSILPSHWPLCVTMKWTPLYQSRSRSGRSSFSKEYVAGQTFKMFFFMKCKSMYNQQSIYLLVKKFTDEVMCDYSINVPYACEHDTEKQGLFDWAPPVNGYTIAISSVGIYRPNIRSRTKCWAAGNIFGGGQNFGSWTKCWEWDKLLGVGQNFVIQKKCCESDKMSGVVKNVGNRNKVFGVR